MPKKEGNSLLERMRSKTSDVLGFNKAKSSNTHVTDKRVQLSQDLLEDYQAARQSWSLKFVEANEFRNGAQWTSEQTKELKRRGQKAMVVNRIHPIIETAKAMLTAQRPRFAATAREDADKETAKIFSDLFTYIWEKSNGNDELKRTIDDYYVGGLGCMQVYQDPHADFGKGDIKLKSLYPLDVYIDPNARDPYCRDAAHILVSQRITDEQAKKIFPDYWNIIKKAEESSGERYPGSDLDKSEDQQMLGDYDDGFHTKREYIERYTKVRVPLYHIFEPQTGLELVYDKEEYEEYKKMPVMTIHSIKGGEIIYVVDEKGVEELFALMKETEGVFHLVEQEPFQDPMTGQIQEQPPQKVPGSEIDSEDPNVIPNSTTYLIPKTKGDLLEDFIIASRKILENRIKQTVSVGTHLMFTRMLPCGEYPIITMMNIHNRNPYPESDVRLYKPIQEYINKIRSLIIAHASTSTNVKLLIPRGSVNKKHIEEEWGRSGTAVIEFDAELGAPVVAGPVPLPNELYKNESDAKYELEYGFGIHDIMMGASQNAPTTFRGTVAIDEYGQRRSKSKRDDVENFLNQLAIAAIPLIQQLYTDEKIIRLVNPDNTQMEQTINMPLYDQFTMQEIGKTHDITVGKYDIIVVSGSTLPSNRWAQLETYMQMFQAGLIDQLEVLKKTEIVDTQGVMERMNYVKQLEQQLESVQEELKKVKGDLQTSEREEVHAKKRLEVEKFSSKLDKASNKADMTTQLYSERLNDTLKTMKTMVKPLPNQEGRS